VPIQVAAQLAGTAGREQTQPAPAHLAYVEGDVSLEREGQAEAPTSGLPLIPGDRLRTSEGRAEILFPDGSVLDVDVSSTLDLQSDTLLRLTSGRVLLTVRGTDNPSKAARYQVDTPAGSAATAGRGDYRIAVSSGPAGVGVELAVLRGVATLTTERGASMIGAGRRSFASETSAPTSPEFFNSAQFDDFDRWADARRAERTGRISAQYLPSELDMYSGTFDRYGQWQQETAYGYVWYPSVAADWRPYYRGHWSPYRRFGWTWIGSDYWAWPTHHYGRWGYHGARWFWVPGRHWSPAWVHWAAAPGYVSWCPLGFDNRPVFPLTVSVRNPWHGWVVVPRAHFGSHRYYVPRHSIPHHRLDRATPFVVQASAPVAIPHRPRIAAASGALAADTAAPRGSRGGDVPNRLAVPRIGAASLDGGRPGPGLAGSGGTVSSSTEQTFSPGVPRAIRRTPEAADPPTSTSPERPFERRRATVPARATPSAASTNVVPNNGAGEVTRFRPGGDDSTRGAPFARRREASVPQVSRPPQPEPEYRDPAVAPRERSRAESRPTRQQAAPGQSSPPGRESPGARSPRRDGSGDQTAPGNGRSRGSARRRSP
jgi:hypothetical protein